MVTVSEERADLAALLIEPRAAVDIEDKKGRTALIFSEYIKDEEIVKLLKAAGAE